jgi:hypothetical protein
VSISAVVCSHSDHKNLLEAIVGLQNQTVLPKEMIILCSGYESMPFPGALMEENYNDWGHEKRAKGLSIANSEFLFFVNSDDYYEKTFIEKMLQVSNEADLVYCNFTSHLFGGSSVDSHPAVGAITSGSFIVRTDFARRVGYNHRGYDADGRFIVDIMNAGARAVKMPLVLYHHR